MSAPSSGPAPRTRYSMLETALDRAIEATILILTAFVMAAPFALLIVGWLAGVLTY